MNDARLYRLIHGPHISEKSTRLADQHRQLVFHVALDATKPEVRYAVEKLFKVEVQSVQIANVKGKVKRFGSTPGRRVKRRRAFVRLKPGHDIDFLGTEQ